ncbi:unnamed protein product [Cladocopium goreaui]|uniref:Methyltransferase-like protein 24 n=1 Tax=Cladocopium goreaui TaxID=2562237 RepID=A0A9P1CAY7_9DINO|nr:unnamed protein product [Cladocopium goreaui]
MSRTKTTGPGKVHGQVHAFVHRSITLTGHDWIDEGMQLFRHDTAIFPRDYLVPAPTENWQAMRKKLVEPPQLSNYFRMVLQMLGTPKFEDGRWRVNASMELVPVELSLFWKGHSPRHFLPQTSAAIGCDKHDRDFLGRWSIGRVGSNAYLHTSRQITERIQQQVRDSFYGAEVAYDESELLDSVREFAEKSDLSGQRVRRRHKMLPLPKAEDMVRYGYEEESDEEDPQQPIDGEHPAPVDVDDDMAYFVTVSRRTGFRRLHVTGKCHVHAERCQQAETVESAEVREALRTDFRIDPATSPETRADVAKVLTAWELSRSMTAKEQELQAETKVLGMPRVLQHTERQAMVKAVEVTLGKLQDAEIPSNEYLALKVEECEANEPQALGLDEVSSRSDTSSSALQTSLDSSGHVRVTKVKTKGRLPEDTESLRRALKLEAISWLCMSAKFRNKTWLHGLELQHWTKYTEYLLGEKVLGLKFNVEGQTHAVKPPWAVILSYEQKMRKEVFKLVQAGTHTVAEGLAAVIRDAEIKEAHFTAPIALGVGWNNQRTTQPQPNKWQRTSYKGKPQHKGAKGGKGKGKSGKGNARDFNGSSLDFDLNVREVDIERSESDDLSSAQLWEQLFAEIRDGKYDVIIMSPPCGTWSRVRFQWQLHPGPRPQRNKSWPWGFPWLSAAQRKKVDVANYFVSQTIQAAYIASAAGTFFLIEHPEDLGSVNGEYPASIWQLEDMRDLQIATEATTWAIFQCAFGADTSKPTRFLSTIPGIKSRYAKWPSFDQDGRYLGPLPARCTHKRHVRRLIGKDSQGRWVTGPAAAYPPGLCKYLATLVASVLRKGDHHRVKEGLVSPRPVSPPAEAVTKHVAPESKQIQQQQIEVDEEDKQSLAEQPAAQAVGTSKTVEVQHTVSRFNWGRPLMVEWSGEEREIVDGFGLCSPNRWAPGCRGVGQSVRSMELNTKIHDLLRNFVHEQLGDLRLMAFKLATGKLTESPFGGDALDLLRKRWAALLPVPGSAMGRAEGQPFFLDLMAQTLKIQEDPDHEILVADRDSFSSGVPVGYEEPIPPAPDVFRARLKQSNLDSSEYMEEARNYKSAVENKEGLESKFREDEAQGMMFPTTMGVLKERYPGKPILVAAMGAIKKPDGSVRDTMKAFFTVSADIKAAHRLVARLLLDRWILQLVYVDDLHVVCVGEQKFETLWMAIAAYEALGTPFGYKKFSGGMDVQFVGYRVDYRNMEVGISGARGQWLLSFLRELRRDGYTVHVHRFAEFLGRLGFTCRVLLWLKPHLAPLYSWASAVSKSTVATAPRLVRLVCMFLEKQFEEQKFMFSCVKPQWFSVRVTPRDAPYLFKENGDSEWASAPAELLAVLVALRLFGYLEPKTGRTCIRLWIQSGTDNRSIDFLSKKNSTTRWPLTLVNMQLSHFLMRSGVRLSLAWRPRDENTLADDLTNSKFGGVDMDKRISCLFSDLDLSLLASLWEAREEYLDRDSWAVYGKGKDKGEKTAWG